MEQDKATRHGERTVFFSSEAGGDMRLKIGTAHYSYGIVARRFARLLHRANARVVFLAMPEKYKRPEDIERECGFLPEYPVHISFRSTENLRPLPAAFNICHFAWEFDTLSDRILASEPVTKSQKHMLSLMDEIWVPSSYTREVLAAHGLSNVHIVPTPVCGAAVPERPSRQQAFERAGAISAVPYLTASAISDADNAVLARRLTSAIRDLPAIRDAMAEGGKVFLTVCNPGDRRKNLLNTIDGFLMATRERGHDVLVIKLAVPATEVLFEESPFEHLRPRYNGAGAAFHPRVVLVSEYLDEAEMASLYGLADYYISPSHCEGHNLPLLEAMVSGGLAIATRNTAMSDYIGTDNAVIIAERRYLGAVAEMAAEVSGVSPLLSFADRFDIARGIRSALALSAEQHAAMVERARAMVMARYSEPVIDDLVTARIAAIGVRVGERRAS
jgi:glycosyltransferase involved in cell wall biosynthesis